MADNKITLEEMGAIQKKRNPKNFSHMTDLEAGKRSLELDANLWRYVKDIETTAVDVTRVSEDYSSGDPKQGRFRPVVTYDQYKKGPGIAGLGPLTAGINFPSSFANQAIEGLESLLPKQIDETVDAATSFVQGGAEQGIRAMGTRDDSILGRATNQEGGPMWSALPGVAATAEDYTEEEQVFRGSATQMQNNLLSERVWIEDPALNTQIAAGLFVPPLRALGMPSVAALIRAASPTTLQLRTLNEIRKGPWKEGKGAAGVLAVEDVGLMGGMGGNAVEEAYRVIRRGTESEKIAFNRAMNASNSLGNFFSNAQAATRAAMQQRSANWRAAWPHLQPKRPIADIHRSLQDIIFEELKKWGAIHPDAIDLDLGEINWEAMGVIKGGSTDVSYEVLSAWVGKVMDPKDLLLSRKTGEYKLGAESWDYMRTPVREFQDMDVGHLNKLREVTYSTGRKLPSEDTVGTKFIENVYGKFSDQLREDIVGYGDVLDEFRQASEMIEGFQDASGITRARTMWDRQKLRNAQVKALKGFMQALKDNPSSELSAGIIRDMERASGISFMPSAAGAMFSNWVGTGLISRAELAGSLNIAPSAMTFMLGGDITYPVIIMGVMTALHSPLVSPKLVGRSILPAWGFVGKQKDAIQGMFESIYDKIPENWDMDSMNYLQAAQRLHEQAVEEAAKEGRIVPSNTGLDVPPWVESGFYLHPYDRPSEFRPSSSGAGATSAADWSTFSPKTPVRDFTGIR
jgi:hypothetical protein|tara:strand:+ start:1638 stop:3866 length:2229 start_codon:yes stop_codon:yes gene_type:complete